MNNIVKAYPPSFGLDFYNCTNCPLNCSATARNWFTSSVGMATSPWYMKSINETIS